MELQDYIDLLPIMELRERILCGWLMLYGDEAPKKVITEEKIDRRIFHFAEPRAVFCAVEEMYNQGLMIDGATVLKYMIENKTVREINGLSTINDYLVCVQYVQRQSEDFTLEYLLNVITAGFEYREMHFLIDRYDFNFEGGEDID